MPTIARVCTALLLFAPMAPLPAQIVFAPPHTFEADSDSLVALAAGDVNGDGFADLALAHGQFLPPGVRLGDGTGDFNREIVVDQPIVGSAVALADLTGDHVLDLLVGQTFTSPRLEVMAGVGDGTFGPTTTYATLSFPLFTGYRIHTGDFDGDGDVDVLSVAPGFGGFPGQVRVLRNDGTGALTPELVVATSDVIMDDVLAADVNDDGRADLLMSCAIAGPAYQIRVLLGQVGGGFALTSTLGAGPIVALSDLDDDGVLDVVAHTAGSDTDVRTLLGAGGGSFTLGPVTAVPILFDETVDVADLDSDGLPDLMIGSAFPAEAHFLRGVGDGSFAADVPYSFPPSTNAWYRLFADFDGDGRTDASSLLKSHFSTSIPDQQMVAFNRTYAADAPPLDLGHALLGSHGWPIQIADGAFTPGSHFAFDIAGAPPSGVVAEYIGLSALMAPFKGGVFVPMPTLRIGLVASAGGTASLSGTWPASLPSGLQLYFQAWFKDAPGPHGFGSTSGLRITLP